MSIVLNNFDTIPFCNLCDFFHSCHNSTTQVNDTPSFPGASRIFMDIQGFSWTFKDDHGACECMWSPHHRHPHASCVLMTSWIYRDRWKSGAATPDSRTRI